jgi:hypothetical protein
MTPTRKRAEALRERRHTAYWIVVSYQDGVDLLAGMVPRAVRQQLLPEIKRAKAESADEYAARIAQTTKRPRRKAS